MKLLLSAANSNKYIEIASCAKQENCLDGEMLSRTVCTVGVCFGFVLLPMASFRQEGNNVLLQLMKIACPPFCSCWGVVVALAACSVRIPVCAPTSSSKEAALAQAPGGFPSGERSRRLAPCFLTLKPRKKMLLAVLTERPWLFRGLERCT